jgi:hypothetical protein
MTVKRVLEAVRRSAKTGWLAGRSYYLDTDKAHFETEMAAAFGKAKQLSDFLGMLVRLTFAIVFVRYCFTRPDPGTSYWQQSLRSTAGGVGFMLTVYFGVQISKIIFTYFMRDMAVHRKGWIRAITLVAALYFYWSVVSTISHLAESLAAATKMVP